MNEVLTRAGVEARFPNEWILMVDPDPGTDINFRGRVVAHEKDKRGLLRKAMELPLPRNIAVFFSGPVIPPGMMVLGLTPRGYFSEEVRAEVARIKRGWAASDNVSRSVGDKPCPQ
jgi:hypothetical protein